jgi:hypothetical protein
MRVSARSAIARRLLEPGADSVAFSVGDLAGEGPGTGRRYQIAFDAVDVQNLRELFRLLRDLEQEKQRGAAGRQ